MSKIKAYIYSFTIFVSRHSFKSVLAVSFINYFIHHLLFPSENKRKHFYTIRGHPSFSQSQNLNIHLLNSIDQKVRKYFKKIL